VTSLAGQAATIGADSLRAVLDSVFAGPDYRWVERPGPFSTPRRWFGALMNWLAGFQEAHPAGFRLLMLGLLLGVLAIFAHAAWVFFRAVRGGQRVAGALPLASGERRDRAWYRREADRLAAAGRYAEAVQADFLALVLALDGLSLLRFHPSKTPAEYGREARLPEGAREEFRGLVGALYGYAFARRPCGAADFAEWRARAAPERYASAG
jgi:hypothetical protein